MFLSFSTLKDEFYLLKRVKKSYFSYSKYLATSSPLSAIRIFRIFLK